MSWSQSIPAWALISALLGGRLQGQQIADSSFDASVTHPGYATGQGPVVAIDEAHHNFHTRGGRYSGFARLLENDGYRVRENRVPFTAAALDSIDVLVIANAIGGEWDAGAYGRSGFTGAETRAVRTWVERGGSLLLISDHAPMGVAAENLARQFGVRMGKGYTEDPVHFYAGDPIGGPAVLLFTRANGLLRDHPVTRGRNPSERVDSIVAFAGQSLSGSPGSAVILALSDSAVDHPSPTPEQVAATGQPGVAWRTAVEGLPTHSARGRALMLALEAGRGRVVVIGEAAMLSAQAIVDEQGNRVAVVGMNLPGTGNRQLGLNVLHWLSRVH